MNIVVGAIVVGVVAWVVAPWVSMARRGTVDGQTRAACRAECLIPSPRQAPDDLPARERSA
jgi:hypothetical protein